MENFQNGSTTNHRWASTQFHYREFVYGRVVEDCVAWLTRELFRISLEHFNITKANKGFIYNNVYISYPPQVLRELNKYSLTHSEPFHELNPKLSEDYTRYLSIKKKHDKDSVYLRHYLGELVSYASNAKQLASLLPQQLRERCFSELNVEITEEERTSFRCYDADYEKIIFRYLAFKLLFN